MLAPLLSFLVLCLLSVEDTLSLRVPLEPRALTQSGPSQLHPRANTTVAVKSASNTQYLANIIVGGGPFTVMIDTGSSDLWITGNIPTKHDLGKTTSVTYAKGQAAGPINSAVVEFSGYTVQDQAFSTFPSTPCAVFTCTTVAFYVQDAASADINPNQVNGLIGLGPSASSNIRSALGGSSGDPFLDRVFRQNTSTPNFVSFLLGREGDAGDTIQGQFTIGEVVPEFGNITNQPKVPVHASALKASQHWSGTIDAIIGPDGKNIGLNSLIVNTPSEKLITIFDTGFTLPQVPRDVSDAIYGRVKGASYDTNNGWWTIPCDQEVNVTIVIAGQNYPIHPLDTSSTDVGTTTLNGTKMCVGTFQPISTALDGTFDSIMGMAFLRNTYTLINAGDFIDGNPNNQGDPFMQLLSVTDPSQAHKDFVQTRLNGTDTTGDSAHALLPQSQAKYSPQSVGEKAKNAFFRYWPWVVAGVGLLVVIGLAVLVFRCCCGPHRRPIRGRFVAGPYRPLHDPPPAPAMDLHTMPPRGAYSDPYYRGGH